METIEFHGWVAELDPEANRSAYAQLLGSGSDICGCPECLAFSAARDKGIVYPPEVLELFAQLGIDPLLESEAYGMGPSSEDPGLYLFGGWFNVIGRLVSDDCAHPTVITPHLQLFPMPDTAVVDPAFGDAPLFRIEFVVALPWLREEPPWEAQR